MRYLGLDLGTKTIGLAISDKTGLIATSYKVLHHVVADLLYSFVLNNRLFLT